MNAAEVFAPGDFLKEEIEARGWSQVELAEIVGRPAKVINEIIAGKKAITPETAIQLGEALGTGPELWMNLESRYQLSKVPELQDVVRDQEGQPGCRLGDFSHCTHRFVGTPLRVLFSECCAWGRCSHSHRAASNAASLPGHVRRRARQGAGEVGHP